MVSFGHAVLSLRRRLSASLGVVLLLFLIFFRLLLLGLHGRVMDIPDEDTLQYAGDESYDWDGEQERLVVQCSYRLVGGA